jgi:glutamine amidotransferase
VIALIDYGAGNLTSVRKGFKAAGAELVAPRAPDDLKNATGIVVPGVGHFGATSALNGGWMQAIRDAVDSGVPLFGICLGLQWLFEGSDEAPDVPGLGVVRGRCSRLPQSDGIKIPHVGWNSLQRPRESRLLAGVADGTQMYFTHSYAAPVTAEAAATCAHGAEFAAAVERDRIFGVQFHPEKSGTAGIRILANFVAAAR